MLLEFNEFILYSCYLFIGVHNLCEGTGQGGARAVHTAEDQERRGGGAEEADRVLGLGRVGVLRVRIRFGQRQRLRLKRHSH